MKLRPRGGRPSSVRPARLLLLEIITPQKLSRLPLDIESNYMVIMCQLFNLFCVFVLIYVYLQSIEQYTELKQIFYFYFIYLLMFNIYFHFLVISLLKLYIVFILLCTYGLIV